MFPWNVFCPVCRIVFAGVAAPANSAYTMDISFTRVCHERVDAACGETEWDKTVRLFAPEVALDHSTLHVLWSRGDGHTMVSEFHAALPANR